MSNPLELYLSERYDEAEEALGDDEFSRVLLLSIKKYIKTLIPTNLMEK